MHEFERRQRRTVSNIDSLKLFATLKEAYPLISMIQKSLLACPPLQSDCEELFNLLGYTNVYSCMCVYDVTHSYLSPNNNEIY